MIRKTPPFAKFEWMIAWRYMKARRRDGGISVLTWISLIGITLAVFALIATLSVRSGFRTEFVKSILSTDGHVAVSIAEKGGARVIKDYAAISERISKVSNVTRAAPLVVGQVMINSKNVNLGAEVYGILPKDLRTLEFMTEDKVAPKARSRFATGIALGSGLARRLGVEPGDTIKLISPNGVKTAFGTSPRIMGYDVAFVFEAGRYDIDHTRIYLPMSAAQTFFNKEGAVDEIEVMVSDPDNVETAVPGILEAAGEGFTAWTWKDAAGGFLRALKMEDNAMFIIMSILVLIASMNIISGLIMLVKNKSKDIGILRTMGLSEGTILRIFLICGASTGVAGTILGVILGCLFAIYIDPVFTFINSLMGGGAWDPQVRGIYSLPAELRAADILKAVFLSITLSLLVTVFPARRAAKLDPVEALKNE